MSELIKNSINVLDKHFPLVKLSRSKARDKPFMTAALKVSIRHKNKLHHKYLTNKTHVNKLIWQKYRRNLTNVLQNAEKLYIHKMVQNHSSNSQEMWKFFGSILNNKNDKNLNITKLKVNDKIVTNQVEITNEFNHFFSNIGKNLADRIKSENNPELFLRNPIANSIFLNEVTITELQNEINDLNAKKSCGHDDLSAKFIKIISPLLTVPLCKVINQALATGVYPDLLKIAKVIPIHKKGERDNVNNYRPISVLSTFNKLFEKIIHKRFYQFLTKYKAFHKFQFGFREKHSTTLALIEIVDQIRSAIESKNVVCGIFADLSKAFDTVDHEILLKKLNHYGIRGMANNLIKSYLSNRKQYVQIGDTKSNLLDINCGVPQGSVLGPLLFLIYVNDIANCNPHGLIRLFADDTNVFIESKQIESLYNDAENVLKYLDKWFRANKLTLNIEKNNFIIFTTPDRRKKMNIPNTLKLNDIMINRTDQAKYLGLILDEELSWKHHIDMLCNKIKRYFPSFYTLRNFINVDHAKSIYYATIHSRIKYGIPLYGTADKNVIEPLQILQNKLLRVLTKKDHMYSTNKLHNELELLKINDIYESEVLTFVYNCVNRNVPDVMGNYFTKMGDTHNINTRNKNHILRDPCYKSKIGRLSVKQRGVQLWNRTDKSLKLSQDSKTFRKKNERKCAIIHCHINNKYH